MRVVYKQHQKVTYIKNDYFVFFMFFIQHCFICRPSDSTVSEDAGIGPRTVATLALAVRRSNHSARYSPVYDKMLPLFRDLYSLKTYFEILSRSFPLIYFQLKG